MIDYYIFVTLSNNDIISNITVKKTVNENDSKILIKIIDKISINDTSYTKPISKFLNDKIINMMVNELNYQIINAELIINEKMLLNFYKERGSKGINSNLIRLKFPHVNPSRIVSINFKLHVDGHIVPTRYVEGDLYGGYVLKNNFKDNQKLMEQNLKDKENKKFNSKDEIIQTTLKEKSDNIELSKNDQKTVRKQIIQKANKSDINIAGFTNNFIDSLDDKQKFYIKSLSELKIKIMKSEIMKKK